MSSSPRPTRGIPRDIGTGQLLDWDLSSLGRSRRIHIYLPPSYESSPRRSYPVLYLHDGQNVFSSAGRDACFGWGSWELDLTVDALCHEGKMQETVMVAVDNTPARLEEYSGRRHSSEGTATPFEDYEKFLIRALKPRVDREFRTLTEAARTAVMGSSMGGVCSLALAWHHPEIFGGAASLSGSFRAEHSDFLDGVLRKYDGLPKPFRAYLDSGVVGSLTGDDGCAQTDQVAAELRRIGWSAKDLELFVDKKILTQTELPMSGLPREKWAEAQTSQHNEFYWRRRAWRALTFLFPLQRKNG